VSFADKTLTCRDCGQEFIWTAGEQEFYASRGLRTPRAVAPLTARHAVPVAAVVVAVAVVDTAAAPAKCSPRPAATVARKPACRSSREVTSPSTAATASSSVVLRSLVAVTS